MFSIIIICIILYIIYFFKKETYICPCKTKQKDIACDQYNTATHVFGMGWKF